MSEIRKREEERNKMREEEDLAIRMSEIRNREEQRKKMREEEDLALARRIQEEELNAARRNTADAERNAVEFPGLVPPESIPFRDLDPFRPLSLFRRRSGLRRDVFGEMELDEDFLQPDISMMRRTEVSQPIFHFGNNFIVPPGHMGPFGGMGVHLGGMGLPFAGEGPFGGMSYEYLANLPPVSTPATNLDQLPEFSFKKSVQKKSETQQSGGQPQQPVFECSICLTEFSDGDSVKTLPCAHQFHSGCINKWLEDHNTCPVCKTQVDK